MTPADLLLPSLLAVLLGTVLATEWLRTQADRLALIDRPGGRKSHLRSTPVVGGLGMAFGLLLVWLMVPLLRPSVWMIFGFVALLILGAADDRRPISPVFKLVLQALVVGVSLNGEALGLQHVGELLPGLDVGFGPLAIPVAIFAVLSVINAFNMIDGVDGLSGSIGSVSFSALALSAWIAGDSNGAMIILLPIAALGGFLLFNLRWPKRSAALVFMGDAGSLAFGYLLGVFALWITQGPAQVPALVAVWACALPLLDALTVIQRRSARGLRVTSPGADHLHHLLSQLGYSVRRIVLIESLAAAAFATVGIALWLAELSDWVSLMLLLLLALVARRASEDLWTRVDRRQLAEQDGSMSGHDRMPAAQTADESRD